MAEAEPQLLSLLQKVVHPLQQLLVKVKLNGVFAPPQQWKTTDELNPNIFGYSIKVLGQEFKGGKIEPRKLTQKEQRQLQQKNKKGAKKQTKQDKLPPPPQVVIDQAEQERKQRQWDELSEQQKFYLTQQDPCKSFSLQFQQKQKDIQYNNETINGLQQKINSDTLEIILTRKPEISEEEITKLKKTKPKNLNLGELYPMVYQGIIKTKQFQQPGQTHITQRVKISLSPTTVADASKIQADACYISIQLLCSQPITPQVKQIKPKTQQILPTLTDCEQETNPVVKLKVEIFKSIKAISQQYFTCFCKQKQYEEKKHVHLNSISTLRLNQINRRKEVFANQFVSSGKFSLLKQRLSKSIKSVIIDKFRKEKEGSTISNEQINSTLSQLNLYFQEEFSKIIDEFMTNESANIHEDLALGYQCSRQIRKTAIAPILNETQIQREMRLADQYDILEKDETQTEKVEEHYINVLMLTNNSLTAKQSYAKYCLKCRKFNQAFVLYSQIAEESKKQQDKLIKAVFLLERRRLQEVERLISEMMEDKQCQIMDKINYHILLSFMYEREKDIKSSQKYLAIAERYYKIKNNPYLKFTPLENPYQLPKPNLPKPERYTSQLTHIESQQVRLNFMNIIVNLNFYNLVSQYLPKLEESTTKTIYEIQTDVFNKKYDDALNKVQIFLEKDDNCKNIDYLLLKADICYRADKMFECQQIFLNILHLKPPSAKLILIYLRLGQTYLNRKSWQDAKQIFEKACEHKYNCSVAWLGLGISNLNLECYNQAEQALNLSKIYNPFSHQTDQYQEKINEHQKLKYEAGTARLKQQSAC